ncbi:hypothetical protein GGF46_002760 [Coemansia sp. RSA 552]|nr:hypothetical protein GGF46_002760 [Coemansia sp. RSA 552]
MRHSLKEYHHYNIAATCLFLACKAEESLRKLESFIPVIVHYASKGNSKAGPGTSEFEKWRAVILRTEVVVLEALCFDVVVDQPHVQLAELAHVVRLPPRLGQMAWSFIADCMRLPICLVYPPRSVACAAVELAARVAPTDARTRLDRAWLDQAGASRPQVAEIVQWLLEFYVREAQARAAPAAVATPSAIDRVNTPASSPASSAMSPLRPADHCP